MISVNSQNTEVVNNYDIKVVNYWIASQYKNMSVKLTSGRIETSVDNSENWRYTLDTSIANSIFSAKVLKNGNILYFTNDNKIYLSDIELTTFVEKTVYESDGVTPYVFHTPVNSSFAGYYFYPLTTMEIFEETDLFVWGNYGNVEGGAVPSVIWYTPDFGETIKVSYKFGQNTRSTDDGTIGGGTGGNLLGDPTNPIVTRHIHTVIYSQSNDKWYCITGDVSSQFVNSDGNSEIHWLEGSYDAINDSWSWEVLDFGFEITRAMQLKIVGLVSHGDYLYYATDLTNPPTPNNLNGIWRAPINTVNILSTHELLFPFDVNTEVCIDFIIDRDYGGFIFLTDETATTAFATKIYTSQNYGTETAIEDEFLDKELYGISSKNENRHHLIQTAIFSPLHDTTIMIKPNYQVNE